MGWWQGVQADVEGRSFATRDGWHRYLVQQDAAAHGYKPGASSRRTAGVQAKLDERAPYMNGAGVLLNWLMYEGAGSSERRIRAAMEHITKCIGG